MGIAVTGGGEDSASDDPKKVEGKEDKKDKAEEKEETENLAIGDSVDFDGITLTLNEARIESGGELDKPQKVQFIVVNLTAENNKDKEQTMSSILNVELKDADGYSYTTTILTEGIQAQFDGTIEPGGTLKGEIPFDVSKSDTYELHFSNPFKSGKAIWKIPADRLKTIGYIK